MQKLDKNFFKTDDTMHANSIEEILDEDEQVLLREKPYAKAYIWSAVFRMLPIALIWLLFDGFFIAMVFVSHAPAVVWAFLGPFFAFHLMPVWMWISGIIGAAAEIKNLEYVFTEKRIIVRSGIVGIDYKNVFYVDIKGVNLRVGLIDRIFKVGDIVITALEQTVILHDIKNPYRILKKMQKIVTDIKTDTYFPNALRPGENKGFRTKYRPDDDMFK